MALVKCSECGKSVSDTNDKCIHCGAKIEKEIICSECKTKNAANAVECKNCGFKFKTEKKSNNNLNLILFSGIFVFLIILIVILINLNKVKIPNLYNTTLENAQTILTNLGLAVNVEYVYNDTIEEGKVIYTEPDADKRVSKSDSVRIFVSKGPSLVTSTNAVINWYNISSKDDDWEFTSPYIEEGYLYIECNPQFGKKITWKDEGFGSASINDTFSKTVPVEINYESKTMAAGERKKITLKIPTQDLDVNKPTTLYLKLYTENETININFAISW